MSLPANIKSFIVRFVVALIITAGLYAGWQALHTPQPAQRNNKQKVADLRAALDENYIASLALIDFEQANAADAGPALDNLHSQYESSLSKLTKNYGQVPANLVSRDLRQRLQAIINHQQDTAKDFNTRYKVLRSAINYNPGSDLDLPLDDPDGRLAGRVNAAVAGLSKAARNYEPLVVEDATRAELNSQVTCLKRLGEQLIGHSPSAATTRTECINGYQDLRTQAIDNVRRPYLVEAYRTHLDNSIPVLLKQLDQLKAGL